MLRNRIKNSFILGIFANAHVRCRWALDKDTINVELLKYRNLLTSNAFYIMLAKVIVLTVNYSQENTRVKYLVQLHRNYASNWKADDCDIVCSKSKTVQLFECRE
jgi:hypothetical protein